jgi:SAM-dependent methyltransferase
MSGADDKNITTESYRKNAKIVADKFDRFPPRVQDIERAVSLCGKTRPTILEIGYGSGRDAKVIVEVAGKYIGIDVSPEMAEIARGAVPGADFRVADVAEFDFPQGLDIVFAFASLLHSDRAELADVLRRLDKALNPSGVIMICMKHGEYVREVKNDAFGTRVFYLYTPADIQSLLPSGYVMTWHEIETIRGQLWFTALFRKTIAE